MDKNGYALAIVPGHEIRDGYVAMTHATEYQVMLVNNNLTKCDCTLTIDGKVQGTWRLNPRSKINLERPGGDQGKFTFYRKDSPEGTKIGLNAISSDDLGLVSVTFTPELVLPPPPQQPQQVYRSLPDFDDPNIKKRSFSPGGTGLSGRSCQEFTDAESIVYDCDRSVTLHLRLISDDLKDPRPLTSSYSTPIPPPLSL